MKYQVISAKNILDLEKFVNNELRHGWKITGGLATYLIESKEMLRPPEWVLLQAMIHDE